MTAKGKYVLSFGLITLALSLHTVQAEEIFIKSKILKINHVLSYLQTNFVDVIEAKDNCSDAKLEQVLGIYQTDKEAQIYFEVSYWVRVAVGGESGKMERKIEKNQVAFVRLNSGKWFNPINFLYLSK